MQAAILDSPGASVPPQNQHQEKEIQQQEQNYLHSVGYICFAIWMMDGIGKSKFVLFLLTVFLREILDTKTPRLTHAVSTKLIHYFSVKILWRTLPTVWSRRIFDKLFLPAECGTDWRKKIAQENCRMSFPLNLCFWLFKRFTWGNNVRITEVIVVIMNAELHVPT